jgi:glycerate 2-kinase
MGSDLRTTANTHLHAFAEETRARITPVDHELATWAQAGLHGADPYPVTYEAARHHELGGAFPIAVGKAATIMALAWQNAVEQSGIAVIPHGETVPPGIEKWQVLRGDHPLAQQTSLKAGNAVLEKATEGNDIVLLLSGGASAMIEAPTVPPEEHQQITRELQRMGLPIHKWNAARSLLSKIKSGGLAAAAETSGGRLTTLYISDVPGDDAQTVGSGPGVHTPTEELLRRVADLPPGLRKRLEQAAENRPETTTETTSRCLLKRRSPADAAAEAIKKDGYTPRLLEPIDQEVQDAAADLAAALTDSKESEILIAWGEPLVRLPPDPGPGGRTTHLLCTLWGHREARDAVAVVSTTDGVDGASGLGGCYARLTGDHAHAAIAARTSWQTASFLNGLPSTVGGGVPEARTGANCADFAILRPPP